MSKRWSSRWLTRLFPGPSSQAASADALPQASDSGHHPASRIAQDHLALERDSETTRLEQSADRGDAADQNRLGLMLASGLGVLKSEAEARKWLRRAAEQGDAAAQFNLGNLCHPAGLAYLAGNIGEARIESYMWFSLAAAQGHSPAEASCEMLNLQMTDTELQEGNRRAEAFRPKLESIR